MCYSKQLENSYLVKSGSLLTFGSGDCGQLAHGVDDDEDMIVKYPRIVDFFRGINVVSIACGALHNALITYLGIGTLLTINVGSLDIDLRTPPLLAVYTWGCGDDGPLGRAGTHAASFSSLPRSRRLS